MQRSRQAINVAVVLMGLQNTTVAAHRPGTEGAAVSVRIGSALLYVADAETASRFTGAWRSVATAAERHLPRQGNPARGTPMPGVVEPAVMVDAAGSPPAFARLERPAGQASHARVVWGGSCSMSVTSRRSVRRRWRSRGSRSSRPARSCRDRSNRLPSSAQPGARDGSSSRRPRIHDGSAAREPAPAR